MSNKKLLDAHIPGHVGPMYPLDLQNLQTTHYAEKRYKRYPLTKEAIEYFAKELALLFRRVKFHPEFITTDDTSWYAVSFMWIDDFRWRLLFPSSRDRHHEDGTVSAQHLALYSDAEEMPTQGAQHSVGHAIKALFDMDIDLFYHVHRR